MNEFRKWNDIIREAALESDDHLQLESKYYREIDKNNPPRIEDLLRNWVDGTKLYDAFVHGYYSLKDLLPWREYSWSRENARLDPDEWDDLKADIEENGIKNPIFILLGKNSVGKIGEGNHRLAIAEELRYKKPIPVRFLFYQNVEKNTENIHERNVQRLQFKRKLLQEADVGGATVKHIIQTIITAGGMPYIVGGAVRDELMGDDENKVASKDVDFVVCNLPLEAIAHAIQSLGRVNMVGKSFGVVKAYIDGEEFDFAIPRTKETQIGAGHNNFKVRLDPTAPIEDDLSRRDFTFNALAKDPHGKIIDVFGGVRDIKAGIIRAVGNPVERFREDPLRMLRALQFVTRFDFEIESKTAEAIRENRSELRRVASERMFEEFTKAWSKGKASPKKLIEYLQRLNVGSTLFGVDFRPLIWQHINIDPAMRIKAAFVAFFVRGGDVNILRPPKDLFTLLTLAKVVLERNGKDLWKIKGIRRERLEQVRDTFELIQDIQYRELAEKIDKELLEPIEITELDVSGSDLLEMGIEDKQIGKTLDSVMQAVHAGTLENKYEYILDFIQPSESDEPIESDLGNSDPSIPLTNKSI